LFRKTKALLCLNIIFMTLNQVDEAMGENLTITPSLTVSERYESNVFFRGEGREEEDFITTVSPLFDVLYDFKKNYIKGFYNFNSNFYSRNPELNFMGHTGKIEMRTEFSQNLSISVSDTLSYTPDSLSAVGTGIQTSRTDIISNTTSASAGYIISNLTSLNLTISDRILEFDEPSLVDTRTDSASLSLDYSASPSRTVSATYTYVKFLFNSADAETHSLRLGISEKLSPTLSFEVSGGASYIPSGDNNYNWIIQSNLAKSFQKGTLSLGYTRNITNTSGLTEETSVSERASAGLSYILSKSFNITINGGLSKNRSEPSGSVDITSYSAEIAGWWQSYSWMRVGAGYSRFEQWAEGTMGENVSRDQVFLSVILTPESLRI